MTLDDQARGRTRAILQVSTRDVQGGAEGSAWNLFHAYRRRGVESWLAVGTKLSDDPNVFALPNDAHRPRWVVRMRHAQRAAQVAGLEVRAALLGALAWLGEPRRLLDAKLLGREDFAYPGSARLLELPPHRPDIVHCHNLHGNYFDLRVLPALSHHIPIVVNLRDEWLLTGHCAYSLGCERWRTGCGRCPDLTIYPAIPRDTTAYNWRRKRAILRSSRLYLTAPSSWLLERACAAIPEVAAARLVLNAVDLACFQRSDLAAARRALDLPQDAWVVVFSAHSQFKDFATVRDALATIGATRAVTALCLGREGATEHFGHAELRFAGYVTRPQDVACAMQAANVFVHATLAEAFGKGAVEAMACGTPVIASRVGGLPEVVRHGVDGLLVPAADAGALADTLALLMDNRELCTALSAAGRKRAVTLFSLERQAKEFLDWYDEILADWSAWRRTVDRDRRGTVNNVYSEPTDTADMPVFSRKTKW